MDGGYSRRVSDESIRPSALRLIISGGLGAGKSTIAARLRELGAFVIEADLIGHEVLEPEGAAYAAVSQRWPASVVDGRIDRGALAAIVFDDQVELRALEEITHPAISEEIRRRVDEADAEVIAVELPVGSDLLGSGWLRIVVEAPLEIRLARAAGRGMTEDEARSRIAAQPSAEEWRSAAAYVMVNDGTLADLMQVVDELWMRLQRSPVSGGSAGRPGAGGVDTGQRSPDSDEVE